MASGMKGRLHETVSDSTGSYVAYSSPDLNVCGGCAFEREDECRPYPCAPSTRKDGKHVIWFRERDAVVRRLKGEL